MNGMDMLEDLNESQRAAVTYNDGPLLVIAGAGSGKTRVLTYKIAYLLSMGVQAYHILALTFTNKAAREMKERIMRLVPPELSHYLWMGTFHSICARILRQESEWMGYTRDFTIYDTTDSKSLLKQICKEMNLDDKLYKPAAVAAKISSAKNALESPEAYAMNHERAKQDRFDRMYEMAEVYRRYQLRLKRANAMDFDDLLMQTCILLKNNESARAKYQEMFEYILVDEYQDTNYAQYLIVKLLGEPGNHVCVVGDDAQSIYSFRGADIRNILTFQNGYQDAKLFKLERNYRSTQTIVNAANSLIHHNQNQIYKQVYSEKEEGHPIRLASYMSDREEGVGIATGIKRLMMKKEDGITSYDSIAVLYRTNAQSRVIEDELRRLNIPYRIYGGTSFFQRKEVKDAIAYLRLSINPKDNEALNRVINFPARGIGDTTLRKISDKSIEMDVSMMDIVMDPDGYGLDVNNGVKKRLDNFASIMQQLYDSVDNMQAYEFMLEAMRLSGIQQLMMQAKDAEDIDRKENLEQLEAAIQEFEMTRHQEGADQVSIHDFLSEVSLLTDQDEHLEDHTSRVTLMTVHAAKGLEFPVVFISGLEENLFPSQYSQSPSDIEEERRLLYVAITRSMERCYMSYARSRFKNGAVNFSSPSRFLNDIDARYFQKEEGGMGTYSMTKPVAKVMPYRPAPSISATPKPTHLTPVKAEGKSTVSSTWKTGDRVTHNRFGQGIVEKVYIDENTGNEKIDILFDTCGKKTLLLAYAKLS